MDFIPSRIVTELPGNYFNAMKAKIALYRSRGIDVIDLASGNPDQPTPEHIVAALKEAVDKPENQGYPPFYGKSATLEAIAAFYQREYGVGLDPETEVAVFSGSGIGVVGIPQSLLNPGDLLLTVDPAYPAYHAAAALAGARVHTIPAYEAEGFLPDYGTVPEELARQVKLLMLNYPNNPTGAVATAEFFERTLAFAARYGFPVLNDFAYGAFGFDGHKPVSLLQQPGGKEYGIETYTASKTFNMAGWRFGFAVGNASIIAALKHYHTQAYSTVFGAVQDAAAAALLGPQEGVAELGRLYERRRDVLVAGLRELGWEIKAPQGTFFAWFRVPEGYTAASFAACLLDEAQVAVAEGGGFGVQGREYVRVSLVNSEDKLNEAVDRIAAAGIFKRIKLSAGQEAVRYD
ncbi:aminotransferase class I/II-fold pyridoxal phosphate-dependent enzyme [Paenibacillus riograndensis]|uniref:Transaminase MtnE n=1 Tax=Paenibacillus riograndensis SBR5 TaxID=1073571 RepID=A0A0E4H8J1_9BACL|nr:aminotransferase class I/II-fold pyridoxal phosphate-dependent enzyme [Paenibacillus riograndensis]CQR53695.1 Transaminase MtnE [Paenibacillus riograndensis SBR5]